MKEPELDLDERTRWRCLQCLDCRNLILPFSCSSVASDCFKCIFISLLLLRQGSTDCVRVRLHGCSVRCHTSAYFLTSCLVIILLIVHVVTLACLQILCVTGCLWISERKGRINAVNAAGLLLVRINRPHHNTSITSSPCTLLRAGGPRFMIRTSVLQSDSPVSVSDSVLHKYGGIACSLM